MGQIQPMARFCMAYELRTFFFLFTIFKELFKKPHTHTHKNMQYKLYVVHKAYNIIWSFIKEFLLSCKFDQRIFNLLISFLLFFYRWWNGTCTKSQLMAEPEWEHGTLKLLASALSPAPLPITFQFQKKSTKVHTQGRMYPFKDQEIIYSVSSLIQSSTISDLYQCLLSSLLPFPQFNFDLAAECEISGHSRV